MSIGAGEPTEVRAFSGSRAGDEKRHAGVLRDAAGATEGKQEASGSQRNGAFLHRRSPRRGCGSVDSDVEA
jgi:hypothetical protein